MRRRRIAAGAVVALTIALLPAGTAAANLPPIKHVWIVLLENKNFQETFGNRSPAPYLSQSLTDQGELLANYYATTHYSLGNYIALVSGQASNVMTQADCQVFTDVFPGYLGADGQAVGQGCVYPKAVKTIADQLDAKGLSWKGYMEDMGNSATQPKTCRHPALNSPDSTQSAKLGDQYAARHDPFVYFHSIIDDQQRCDAHVVPLDRLPGDLTSETSTPDYSFITPNLCNDGHDAPCVDGRPGGLTSADDFLRSWVPRIVGSPAYKAGGMLIVTFDEAEANGGNADASSCCDQPPGPNTPNPGGPVPGSGGGLTGAVVLSPYVVPGSIVATPYNHYSLLRSIQQLFGLGPLGYSGQAGLRTMGDDVFNATSAASAGNGSACDPGRLPAARRGRLPRGSVIARLRVRHRARRASLLEVRLRRAASVSATVRRSRRAPAHRIGPRRLASCRTYRIGLRYRHGRFALRAAVGRASERRTIAF